MREASSQILTCFLYASSQLPPELILNASRYIHLSVTIVLADTLDFRRELMLALSWF